MKDYGIKHVAIAGGVSANSGLRKRLIQLGTDKNLTIYLPPFEYTMDNAAMIGIAGYYNLLAEETAPLSISASAKIQF